MLAADSIAKGEASLVLEHPRRRPSSERTASFSVFRAPDPLPDDARAALCRETGVRFGIENHWYADFARAEDYLAALLHFRGEVSRDALVSGHEPGTTAFATRSFPTPR